MYVKETHMMLVDFWRTLVKIVVVFQHKRQPNKTFPRFVDCLKTPTGIVHALHYSVQMNYSYASDCLSLTTFEKLLQSSQTRRNNKKQPKQVLVMINHIWQTHKLTRYRSKQFSYRTFHDRTNTKVYAYI